MPVNFRSWRDTGITWLALAGVDAAKMLRRAGHDAISTTLGYVKMAEDLRGGPTRAVRAKVWAKSSTETFTASQSQGNSAERAGFESDKKRCHGSSRVAKGSQRQAGQATQGSPSRPPQPKPEESNAAIVTAIKAALDEGRHERAAALLEVLRRTEVSGRVVPLRSVAADACK